MSLNPSYRNIWGITYPIIFAGVGETIIDITDAIFLARYGVTELAAVGLADAIFGVALFLSLGLVDGIQIIIGRRAGQDQQPAIGRVFNQGLYLLIIASIAMILVLLFVLPLITAAVFASMEVHDAVQSYLRIAAYALLFQSFNLAYSAFYTSISRTRVLIGATLVLAITNILLDYVLIFGQLGLPELGIEGAAYATLSAEFAAFLFLTRDVIVRGYTRQYGLLRFARWDNSYSTRLIRISTPVSVEALVETLKWFLFFLIIEQMGELSLASATIIFSCYALFLIPIDSFSETLCSMVSNLIGQRDLPRLRLLLRRVMQLSYLFVLPALLIALVIPELVLAIFTPDEPIIAASINSLLVVVLVTLVAVPAYTYYSALIGTGDTLAVLLIQSIMTIITVATAYICGLQLKLELEFVWLAELAGLLMGLLLSWFWFRWGKWTSLEI